MNELGQFLTSHAGFLLFAAIFVEQIGVPLPAAPVLVGAGAMAADGALSPVIAVAITLVACAPGDLIWYYAGRRRGNRVLKLLEKISFGDSFAFSRSKNLFARYGAAAVVGAKFVPGVSFVIPALAGAFKINFGRFVWLDVLGSLLYGIFYIQLGAVFSDQIRGVIRELSEFGFWTAVLTLPLTVAFAVCARTRKAGKFQSATGSSAVMTISKA